MGPRKTHRKSRNGCPECKSRRLKCDELNPCTNCVKHAIACSYVVPKILNPDDRISPSGSSTMTQPKPPEVNQKSFQQTSCSHPEAFADSCSQSLASLYVCSKDRLDLTDVPFIPPPDSPPFETQDWACSLELLHHYCIFTCDSLTLREDARHVWRVIIPLEGYSNKYVMDGVLAIAALHRAYLNPMQAEKFANASAFHLNRGLKAFREIIASPINVDNWQPIFCFASIITLHVCALPLRLGSTTWPAPVSNMIEIFRVVNGLQNILAPFLPSLHRTQLAPLVNSIWLESKVLVSNPPTTEQSLSSGIWPQISRIRDVMDGAWSQFPHDYNYNHPSDAHRGPQFSCCYEEQYRRDYESDMALFEMTSRQLELAGPHAELGMVLLFASSLSKRLLDDLQEHHPVALVLLAHYCLLLATVDRIWVLNGFASQLFADIEDKIHPEFKNWLEWPKKILSQR